MKRFVVFGSCLLLLCLLAPWRQADADEKISAVQAWKLLKDGNGRFATDMLKSKEVGADRRKELAEGQNPFAIILSCADSRVPPEIVFDQGLGDLFVLRVAGNIGDPYVLGSIEYAVEHLHVPLIVVLGHESCGAVQAALGTEKLGGNLGKLISEVYVGKDLPADKKDALASAVKNNTQRQAESIILRSEVVKEHVEHKKVRIVSGVYGLATGKVSWLTAE